VPFGNDAPYDLIVDTPRAVARFTGNLGTAYPLADEGARDAALTEREAPDGERRPIPRMAWSFVAPAGGGPATEIKLDGGFKPGRIYQLVYTARDPIVVALGMEQAGFSPDLAHGIFDGKTIAQDCNSCHEPLGMDESSPEILKTLGISERISSLQKQ